MYEGYFRDYSKVAVRVLYGLLYVLFVDVRPIAASCSHVPVVLSRH